MAQATTTVILKVQPGGNYTKKGENIAEIEEKRVLVTQLMKLGAFDKVDLHELEGAFAKVKDAISLHDLGSFHERDDFSVSLRKKVCDKLYTHMTKDPTKHNLRMMCELYSEFKYDILTCHETDMLKFLNKKLDASQWGIAETTFGKWCSGYRVAFNMFGREYAWGDGEAVEDIRKRLVFYSGNPMSDGIQKQLKQELENKQKGSKKRGLEVTVDGEQEVSNMAKVGLPMSVVVLHYSVVMHLAKAVEKVVRYAKGKWNAVNWIENLLSLALLKVMLMHEAGRPLEELAAVTEHSCWSFICHESVPFLTFVFLNTDTLAFLFRSPSALGWYKQACFKGKKTQDYVTRIKSVIPCEQNALDLLWNYTVILRIMYQLNGDMLQKTIFPKVAVKRSQNLSQINGNQLEHLELQQGATFYSIRYGCIEEEARLKVKRDITKARVGHAKKSTQSVRYANNVNVSKEQTMRVASVESMNNKLPLGTDEMRDARIVTSAYEWNEEGIVEGRTIPNWLDQAFPEKPDLRKDFVETLRNVNTFLSTPTSSPHHAAAREYLLGKLPVSDKSMILSDMKKIPLGLNFTLADGMLSPKLVQNYNNARGYLKKIFAEVPTDKETIPELKFYIQTIYGNWGKPFNGGGLSIFEDAIVGNPSKTTKTPLQPPPTTSPDDSSSDEDDDAKLERLKRLVAILEKKKGKAIEDEEEKERPAKKQKNGSSKPELKQVRARRVTITLPKDATTYKIPGLDSVEVGKWVVLRADEADKDSLFYDQLMADKGFWIGKILDSTSASFKIGFYRVLNKNGQRVKYVSEHTSMKQYSINNVLSNSVKLSLLYCGDTIPLDDSLKAAIMARWKM